MTAVLLVFLVLYATADEVKNLRRSSKIEGSSRIAKTATSYVVNHEFCITCLSDENLEEKETLEEVHTYAQLKNDPRADLPMSFTICSSVMATYVELQKLFNLLGNDGNVWLESFLMVDDKTSFSHWRWSVVKLPPVFAHQCTMG